MYRRYSRRDELRVNSGDAVVIVDELCCHGKLFSQTLGWYALESRIFIREAFCRTIQHASVTAENDELGRAKMLRCQLAFLTRIPDADAGVVRLSPLLRGDKRRAWSEAHSRLWVE
jgi:hypothetical protein